MTKTYQPLRSVRWEDDELVLLDQTKLPEQTEFLTLKDVKQVWDAIERLKVRGAPAIGITAAYGVYVAVRHFPAATAEELLAEVKKQADYLATSRPTAVNLFWALNRMVKIAEIATAQGQSPEAMKRMLLVEAQAIQAEDEAVCRAIGEHALTLFSDGIGVLTHCNAGGLATAKYGTATAPMYLAHEKGWKIKVFADETRPVLQGARLTAYELQQAGIDVTLICDNMAAKVMANGWVQAVIVGTDRVAANGDVANKIGTYGLAVLARAHNIPFYVAAPLSSIDLNTPTGKEIPIEEREADEIIRGMGRQIAPNDIKVYNPAFDVTPHELVTAIITEKGIVRAPYKENLRALFEK
ncbi:MULTISPECIES: S-methyl-5-thioribose-1-phosphate isomerase [Aneurinibacillus]|uniref:Methylthioribose-1-phosphate isomerase n=1 Tax=Aneurinibacillus thermoaerophilus TaxID=143495 RepID=A0A1G7YNK8_ANETH|nr:MULTISPECIES: S-methyl-5-thioribose-1-phosphate isomerase [Aneurinibacillus]AMA73788.1 methylthioribose-1-phosphate isomerase [Aneurinibacillus sp. XH2]MED0677144.1 S-methyl-5-thioribose-1-phosphate isomerase [Aneurinibacillus thermoaerophilus]MED0679396.1 S-methyl-5-thioribose-1-phosphate isomerase [Aneurinibacillus thermoaerophilus]MED0738033.1 S-methyl-5-thioribose-1-phosphate isomerase [Aneurinibacillus thermoaerophilus]MED0756454.1 S-methyl-5-thioribose-1-phosphate isomerase [Aneurinib